MAKHSRDVDNEDEGKAVEVDLDGDENDGGVVITIPTN